MNDPKSNGVIDSPAIKVEQYIKLRDHCRHAKEEVDKALERRKTAASAVIDRR